MSSTEEPYQEMTVAQQVGRMLTDYRTWAFQTVEDLAGSLNIEPSHLRRIESGEEPLTPSLMNELPKILGHSERKMTRLRALVDSHTAPTAPKAFNPADLDVSPKLVSRAQPTLPIAEPANTPAAAKSSENKPSPASDPVRYARPSKRGRPIRNSNQPLHIHCNNGFKLAQAIITELGRKRPQIDNGRASFYVPYQTNLRYLNIEESRHADTYLAAEAIVCAALHRTIGNFNKKVTSNGLTDNRYNDFFEITLDANKVPLPINALREKIRNLEQELSSGWEKTRSGQYVNTSSFSRDDRFNPRELLRIIGYGVELLYRIDEKVVDEAYRKAKLERLPLNAPEREELYKLQPVGVRLSGEAMARAADIIGFANPTRTR